MFMLGKKLETLVNENEWLLKAIEMVNLRVVDRGFNVHFKWLGFYDNYCLHYVPECWVNYKGVREELNWGYLEVHSKEKVFNPYAYCGGYGYEYEELGKMVMNEKMWGVIKKYIMYNDYEIDGKKICFDNPYYERVEFYQGSDVPINGEYE